MPDLYDFCPDTEEGKPVDEFGCAEEQNASFTSSASTEINSFEDDADQDGVPDLFDICPGTEPGKAVDAFGCAVGQNSSTTATSTVATTTVTDNDGDGVPDFYDFCPNTPASTQVDQFGCPVENINENLTSIPDLILEQKLIDMGLDDVIDGWVTTENILTVESLDIDIAYGQLSNLTGLSAFENLKSLRLNGQGIPFIDLSHFAALEELSLDNNALTYIDLSQNTALLSVSLRDNFLRQLQLDNQTQLEGLDISGNPIRSLDLTTAASLQRLRVNKTVLPSIDLSRLNGLTHFEGIRTPLRCVNVSEEQLNAIPEGWKTNLEAFYSINCSYIINYDQDNDGIENDVDECPDTPQGQRVNDTGCAYVDTDTDLDGVIDDLDACPTSPKGAKVNANGCAQIEIDSDLDGVENDLDYCPDTPKGIAVNERGCSETQEKVIRDNQDDDNDGVINILDRCEDTPAGTTVDESGCTPEEKDTQQETDSDHDGVLNVDDICPDTAAGLVVNSFGCPLNELDSDYDKVTDDLDLCPNTPAGVAVDAYGCSVEQKADDSDLDGVKNSKDYCPNTPPYTAVNLNGCSAEEIANDADHDGVPDETDICPDTAPLEEVDENGCAYGQRDNDHDGVANALDRCEGTAAGDKVDEFGCSFAQIDGDDDEDGVLNSYDKCPETPAGTEVDENGCAFIPPVIESQSFEQTEMSRDATETTIRAYLGKILVEDPNAKQLNDTASITLDILESEDSALFELVSDSLFLVDRIDFEEKNRHVFTVRATNDKNQSTTAEMELKVMDIPNTSSISNFSVAVFDLSDETSSAKVDYRRYLNPKADRGVGKWKIKKKIVGGADAGLFSIQSRAVDATARNGASEVEDYLDFINPPDFENPMDANGDNIYEVEVVNINTNDGESTMPISVMQTNIVVPENDVTALQLQSVPVNATDDSDGDGVPDISDNSPFVANPNQEDTDGDGVGDVTDDADHDGVWNPNDQCNDTPLNSKVNINGCRIFYLPPTNFRIKTSERCIGQNSIQLAVEDSSLQYNIAVSGSVNASASFSGDQWSLGELNAGQYTLCVTVDGVDPTEFERCFTVGIDEPQPLSVYGSLSTSGKSVRYSLKGGDVYTVTHNGKSFQTADNSFDIALEEGINTVQITTGIDCQGVFEQEYFNSSEVSFTPNPFQDYLNVFVGGNDNEVTLEIFTSQGRLIEQSIHQLQHKRMVKIPTAHLQPGSYIVKTCGQTTLQSTLIVKK